jgi:hypothetical protein
VLARYRAPEAPNLARRMLRGAGVEEVARRCVRNGLPAIEAVPPSAFSSTHGRANEPEHKEDDGHDPEQVEGKAESEEQQDKEECE